VRLYLGDRVYGWRLYGLTGGESRWFIGLSIRDESQAQVQRVEVLA
jgi:hypothetical protein